MVDASMIPRPSFFAVPADMVRLLTSQAYLAGQLTRREVAQRYRTTVLGALWTVLQPLFMLAIFTFVFGFVMKARWPGLAAEDGPSGLQFASLLFSGLLLHGFLAECLGQAPGLVVGHVNYVKRLIFPLEVLALPLVGSALVHLLVGLAILGVFVVVAFGGLPPTALLVPVVLAPFLVLMTGLVWLLAALGVFFRDIGQVIGVIVTALLFLSPIFFPIENLPAVARDLVVLNPLTVIVTEIRAVAIWGKPPDWTALGIYTVVSFLVAWIGYYSFVRLRRSFADVV